MSRYNRLIILFLFVLSFLSANKIQNIEDNFKNDVMVLAALDYQNNKQYIVAGQVFEELYNDTQIFDYLKRAFENYSSAQLFEKVSFLSKKNFTRIDELKYLQQQYILSNVVLNKYDEALNVAKKLLKNYPTTQNYLIVGDLYFVIGSYKHAKRYYKKAYTNDENINALFSLVEVLYKYLDEKQKAIEYLNNHKKQNGCSLDVCSRLIKYYQDTKEYEKMLQALEEMYTQYKTQFNQNKLEKVQKFIVETYQSIDIYKAISFLEETGVDFDKLLSLYSATNQFNKALLLAKEKYNETKKQEILGHIAIFEFELAKNKNEVLQKVLKNFEKALMKYENANFENYYGYILIDYDLDIKKGLELVKKALNKQPDNLAYKDSVAWGLFKLQKCEEAYKYMQEVVDSAGLENEEIKYHYEEIRKCIDDIR